MLNAPAPLYTMLYRTKRNLILSFYLFAFVRHFNYYRMQTMLEEQKHLPSSPSPKIFHMTLGNLVFYYNEKMEKPVVHFWLAKWWDPKSAIGRRWCKKHAHTHTAFHVCVCGGGVAFMSGHIGLFASQHPHTRNKLWISSYHLIGAWSDRLEKCFSSHFFKFQIKQKITFAVVNDIPLLEIPIDWNEMILLW